MHTTTTHPLVYPQFVYSLSASVVLNVASLTYPDAEEVIRKLEEAISLDIYYIGGVRVVVDTEAPTQSLSSTSIGCSLLPRMTFIYAPGVHRVSVRHVDVHDPLYPASPPS